MANRQWKREVVQNVSKEELSKPKVADLIPEASYRSETEKLEQKRSTVPDYQYQDFKFPPAESSILFSDSFRSHVPELNKLIWKRPYDLTKTPSFLKAEDGSKGQKGYSSEDVVQGQLSNCYFLSALAGLANRPKAMKRVVPAGQEISPQKRHSGLYHFRFWQFGTWVDVVVDDLLPVGSRGLYFGRSSDESEFWISLVEKAYAKLYGSYEAIGFGGLTFDALVDLTGGLAVRYFFKDAPGNMVARIKKAVQFGSFVSLGMAGAVSVFDRSTGLQTKHSYTVTLAEEIDVKGKKIVLFRVRNPWGRADYEWIKDWSDKDTKNWDLVSKKDKKRLEYPSGAGEWYMCYEDIEKNFDNVTICTVGQDLKEDGVHETSRYHLSYAKGSWESGVNSGGPFTDNSLRNFSFNPQYLVKLSPDSSDPDGLCSVFIGLMQKYEGRENEGRGKLRIGYRLYEVDKSLAQYSRNSGTKIPPDSFNKLSLLNAVDDCERLRELSLQTDFESEKEYLFVPFTKLVGDEEDYLLRIYSEDPLSLVELM